MTVRFGIIGCGDIARRRVARAIQSSADCELIAACRRDADKLRQFCADFDVPRGHASCEALLADDDIDAVYVASPVADHLPHTLAAAAAGKHVLCEKPMAKSAAECDAMIAACREAGVQLGVAYYRRFYPSVLRIKQLLAAGEIAAPLAASVVCATPLAIAPGEDGYWRTNLEAGGGGALMDIGSHRINLLLDLFGPATDVAALCATVAAGYEAEDVATLALRFADGPQASLTCVFGAPTDPDEFSILGTRGRIAIAPLNGSDLVIETAAGRRVETHPAPANLHAPLVADFAAAVLAGRPPTVSGEEGRATTAVMDRAYASARG
ncbi:MAG: Gfo/Idh/MocA family oxidoreductase [Planctomycetales bacterium]|nr:Gfo/Idh/MocA family oxidoreductase [Planctomycetales bacterium]